MLFLQPFNIVRSVKKNESIASSPPAPHTFKKSINLQCFGKNTGSDSKGVKSQSIFDRGF